MHVILAATDLSSRSDLALDRAAMLAGRLDARLLLLHAVDPGRPSEPPEDDIERVMARLRADARRLAGIADVEPEVFVRIGDPRKAIIDAAREFSADLIVLGPRGKHAIRDLFVDSTAARVLRAGRVPVLLVNRSPIASYRRVLAAADLADDSGRAAHRADLLGLLEGAELSVVHAFQPYAKGVLVLAGSSERAVKEHVERSAAKALNEIVSSFRRDGLNISRNHVTLEEADPVSAILKAVKRHDADLLVVGTRGFTGLKRLMLGTTAGEILRLADCDVLAVPAGAAMGGRSDGLVEEVCPTAEVPAEAPGGAP